MDKSLLRNFRQTHVNYKGLSYLLIITLISISSYFLLNHTSGNYEPIKVGVLFSETGVMASTEKQILRATLLAIDQINKKGGVRGRQIEPIVYDIASNWRNTGQLATKLIVEDKVVVIFGGFTSADRKEIREVVEKYDNLLMYPNDYEGIEISKNIIYLGMAPNQKLIPAVSWAFEQKKRKMYLIGSDSIWARVANEIISHEIKIMGGEILNTQYLPVGSTNFDAIANDILEKKPDFVFLTLVGNSAIAMLYQLYKKASPMEVPNVMSFGYIPSGEQEQNKKKICWASSSRILLSKHG